jgi:ribosomal protein L19E
LPKIQKFQEICEKNEKDTRTRKQRESKKEKQGQKKGGERKTMAEIQEKREKWKKEQARLRNLLRTVEPKGFLEDLQFIGGVGILSFGFLLPFALLLLKQVN